MNRNVLDLNGKPYRDPQLASAPADAEEVLPLEAKPFDPRLIAVLVVGVTLVMTGVAGFAGWMIGG